MGRNTLLALSLRTTLVLLMASELSAATYYVAPSGNDSSPGTNSSAPLRTIKQAASLALNGDQVLVSAGDYTDTFNISGRQSSGTLQFVASETGVVISGQVNVVDSNGIVFTGFKFSGNADRFLTWQGAYNGTLSGCQFVRGRNALLVKSGSLTFDQCTLTDFVDNGIEVDGTAELLISNSQISGCQGSAVKILKNALVTVDASNIKDNVGDGVRVAVDTGSIPVTGSCDCTGTTPQSMKQQAYDLLASVNPQTAAYGKAIADARAAINSSLSPSLWTDAWTATASGGPTVYDRSKTAIQLLNAVYTDNIDFFISGNNVIVNQPFRLSAKVLGAEITYGSYYSVPVTTSIKAGSSTLEPWGSFTSPTQGNVNDNSNPRSYSNANVFPAGTSVSISGRSWLKNSSSYSGTSDNHWYSYLTVSSSSQSNNLKVLRDGDAVPNLAGFGGQASASTFLAPYISSGKIKLAKNQAVFLFELGTTSLSSSAADFQDLVVLITMQPTSTAVTAAEAATILQAMNLAVEADKNLASCAISKAKCGGGNSGAIAEADGYFNAGLTETAAGRHEQASQNYKTAWQSAQNALATPSGTGTVISTSPQPPIGWTSFTRPMVIVNSSTLTGNNSGIAMFTVGSFAASNSNFSNNKQWGTRLRGEANLDTCTINTNGVTGVWLEDGSSSTVFVANLTLMNNVTHGLFLKNCNLNFNSSSMGKWSISGSEFVIAAEGGDLSFSNVNMSGGTTAALSVVDGNMTASNSTFSGSGYGVSLKNSDVVLHDCVLSGNNVGLFADQNESLSAQNSTFASNAMTGASVLGSATFTNCVFENNPNGLQITNDKTGLVELVGSQIKNNSVYGVWCDGCTLTFDASMQADWSVQNNGSNFGATDSTLTFNGFTISHGTTYGIVSEKGTLNLINSTLTANGTGAYIEATSTLVASGTNFTDNTLYGVSIQGQASLQNCTIDRNTHGLQIASLTDGAVTCSATEIYDNTQAGLHLDSCNLTLTGDGIAGLTVSNNRYGIYSTNSTLVFDGFASKSNTYGVWLTTSNVTMGNSTFTGSTYGLWAVDNNSLDISSSTFSGNSSYGVYLQGPGSLHHCSLTGNGSGLYLNATNATDANLTGTQISGNSLYGVYAYSGSLALTSQSAAGWSIDSNGYNVSGYQAAITLTGAKMTNATNFGVLALYGSLNVQQSTITSQSGGVWGFYTNGFTIDRSHISGSKTGSWAVVNLESGLMMRNSVVSGAQYGVYSYDVAKPAAIYNSTIADVSQYGVYAYSGDLSLTNTIISGTDISGTVGTYGLYVGPSANVVHSYNLVSGFAIPYENTTADPTELSTSARFKDAANGDYSLGKGSPAINAGTDMSASLTVDILGNARPSHKVFEIGAYEYMQDGGSLRVLDWKEKR